jgi:hypothetical protein
MRRCLCGKAEERRGDATNLDPVSGLCVDCLIKRSKVSPFLPSVREEASRDVRKEQYKD